MYGDNIGSKYLEERIEQFILSASRLCLSFFLLEKVQIMVRADSRADLLYFIPSFKHT